MSVLNTAARHGLADLAAAVLQVLGAIGVSLTEIHLAPLIEALSASGDLKKAMMILGVMRQQGMNPSLKVARPVVQMLGKEVDGVDKTWAILDEIRKESKPVDISVLNAIIQASVIQHDLQRAIGSYQSFPEYGQQPNRETFHLLLDGCIKVRQIDLGEFVFAQMQEAGIPPDTDTYSKLIYLFLTQDSPEAYSRAFDYLLALQAANYKAPYKVYIRLVHKLAWANDERLSKVLDEMQEMGYRVDKDLMKMVSGIQKRARELAEQAVVEVEQPMVANISLDGAAQRFIETGGLNG